jgi:hypothetical protein
LTLDVSIVDRNHIPGATRRQPMIAMDAIEQIVRGPISSAFALNLVLVQSV